MSQSPPIALVTGGARRVGRAISLELAASGYELWVHYGRSEEEATELRNGILSSGGKCRLFCADLSQRNGQDALSSEVVGALGERELSLLVHNASVFEDWPLEDLKDDTIDRALALHGTAPLRLVRALAPHMSDDDQSLVVIMLDSALFRPPRGLAHYAASKGAARALIPSLCRELAPGTRVVGVSPGQVCWPDDYGEQRREELTRLIPQGRVGTPEEVAKLVRFLALEGTYINGVEIFIDGGASTVGIDRT